MNRKKEKQNLDYFKGVFDTYAFQNYSGINVYYGFGIYDFVLKESIQESFKDSFPEFRKSNFELVNITEDDFVNLLNKWFYAEFTPNLVKFNGFSKELTRNVVADLVESFEIEQIYKVSNLKFENKEVKLGLVTDFFILVSKSKGYLCEFILDG